MWTASGTRNFLLLGPGPYVRARPRPYLTHRLAPQSPRRLRWQGKSDGHGREPRVKASESFSTMYRLCLGSRARSVEADRQQENSRERQPPNTPARTLYRVVTSAAYNIFVRICFHRPCPVHQTRTGDRCKGFQALRVYGATVSITPQGSP